MNELLEGCVAPLEHPFAKIKATRFDAAQIDGLSAIADQIRGERTCWIASLLRNEARPCQTTC
ncbi:hypothetical protein XH80_28850 [Bradyrhizobium sp. CCBAU 45384]|nr:hypothetical protein [Bradyrhizobium sp. CCBAU 45384]